MNARVIGSSGSPPERMTSCTIGGTGLSPSTVDCRLPICRWSLFFRHSSHSPVGPGVPPQEHLRCSRLLRKDAVIPGFADDCIFVVMALLLSRPAAATSAWACGDVLQHDSLAHCARIGIAQNDDHCVCHD